MKHINNAVNEICRTFADFDNDTFGMLAEQCCDTINKGGKVIISGLGKNGPICSKSVDSMISIGINAAYVHTGEILHGSAGIVRDSDLVILTSKTGNTAESLQAARALKAHKACTIWGLTFNNDGELISQGLTDHALVVKMGEEGDPWNVMPMNSTTITLIILQALALEMIDRLNLTKMDFLKNHPGGGIGKANKI